MHDPAAKSTLCLIRDALTGNRISLRVRPADTVNSLYEAVRLNMDRSKDTIQLLLAPSAPAGLPKAPPVQYNEDVSGFFLCVVEFFCTQSALLFENPSDLFLSYRTCGIFIVVCVAFECVFD